MESLHAPRAVHFLSASQSLHGEERTRVMEQEWTGACESLAGQWRTTSRAPVHGRQGFSERWGIPKAMLYINMASCSANSTSKCQGHTWLVDFSPPPHLRPAATSARKRSKGSGHDSIVFLSLLFRGNCKPNARQGSAAIQVRLLLRNANTCSSLLP